MEIYVVDQPITNPTYLYVSRLTLSLTIANIQITSLMFDSKVVSVCS